MPRHTPDDDLNRTLYTIDLFVFCCTYNCICICIPILLSYTARILLVCILLVFVSVFALVFVFYRPVSHHTPDDNF